MSKDNVHSDSENSQSKESHVQDEDYWELEISDEQKVCCLLDCQDCVFYINSSNILLQRILEEKLASAQKQFQIFNSNQKNQKVYYKFDITNVQIADVIRHIKDIDEKTADLAIQSCKGNEVEIL